MKKVFIVSVLIVMMSVGAKAQDYRTSAGLRLGVPVGITLKHFLSRTNAVEGILASRWNGFVATGLYEFEKETGRYPALNWYFGFGAHLGTWQEGYNPRLNIAYSGVVIGADGVIGLEYTFDDLPLNLSIDLLPSVNIIGYTGWGGINGALSVRYVF